MEGLGTTDDLAALNNCGEFEKSFYEIYTPLYWKKESLGHLEVLFLDLVISINDKNSIKRQFSYFQLYACPILIVMV